MGGIRHWQNWEAIQQALTGLEFRFYGRTEDEETFIDDVVDSFRGVSNSHRGEHVSTDVYETHGYPQAEFQLPRRTGTQRCEIADLCFDVTVRVNGAVEDRRGLVSQSKLSSTADEKWKVDLTQHYLLTFLPSFESSTLSGGSGPARYSLASPTTALTNYSLASRHGQPTYCSPADVGHRLHSWNYSQSTSTYRHGSQRTHLRSTVGLTSALVNGYAGSDLRARPGHEAFIDDLVDYAAGSGNNPRPDGGYANEIQDGGRFAVVRIHIDREE